MTGIACAGHWVLDRIKFVDYWPHMAELSNITEDKICNGGAPFNLIVDLNNLQVPFPTYGIGCIGDDTSGKMILDMCHKRGINIDHLHTIKNGKTSYTDVMTMNDSGTRTMFHYRGVNDLFSEKHVPLDFLKEKEVKLFYLGHLLLMAALEEPHLKYGNTAGLLLRHVQKAGIQTVLDIATESANRYQRIVVPVLPYVDHLVINELEAGKTSGFHVRNSEGELVLHNVKKAAHFLLSQGVKKNVIIHMPEGAFWLTHEKKEVFYPALTIPKNLFIATCGAGDAFCSGICVGLHEGWPIAETLRLATAAASISVTSSHNSDGIKPLQDTLDITAAWRH
jgi:sugar/nucleoside kinase (ribokinase family)